MTINPTGQMQQANSLKVKTIKVHSKRSKYDYSNQYKGIEFTVKFLPRKKIPSPMNSIINSPKPLRKK